MPPWLLRGVGMAVLHAAASVSLAKVAATQQSPSTVTTGAVLALLVGVAAAWGALDGWLRRPDRGRAWFIGALLAGVLSGILNVIGRSAWVDNTGVADLGQALTGSAAFIALLVMVPAGLGLLVGSRIRPARAEQEPPPRPPASPRPSARRRPRPRPRARDGEDQRPNVEPAG